MKTPRNETERKNYLGDLVQRSLKTAEGADSDVLAARRAEALKYYMADPRGDEIKGRSEIVVPEINKSVNATMGHMRDMLIQDGELIIESEDAQGDALLSVAEANICTDTLFQGNSGEVELMSSIWDALLMGNGCLNVQMVDGTLDVRTVPIDHCSYTASWTRPFQQVPFFAEYDQLTRSDLVEMGIDKKTAYEMSSTGNWYDPVQERRNVTRRRSKRGEAKDTDLIDIHYAYVLACLDSSGISKRYKCLVANQRFCLEYEEIDHIPYAFGTGLLFPHRLTGESFYDRLRHVQDGSTTFLRQWHDNAAVINNGRYIYNPATVVEDDIFSPAAGGGIRSVDPAGVIYLQVPDISGGLQMALAHLKRERTESVGAALDMASAESQVANKAATQASIEKGNQELISTMIAGTLAQTLLQPLYGLIHKYLREHHSGTIVTKIRGTAVPIDPSEWPDDRRMLLRTGLPPGVKAQQMQALMGHSQMQMAMMQSGMDGILVDPASIHTTQLRLLKLAGIDDAESFMVDPQSPQAQQAAQQKAQAAQQQAQAQQQLQQMMLDIQKNLEKAKLAEDARQADQDIQFKYYDANLKAETKEAEMTSKGVIELEKSRTNAIGSGSAGQGAANDRQNGAGES